MAKKAAKTETAADIELPTIVANANDIAATLESVFVYLMTSQEKYSATDPEVAGKSVFTFIEEPMDCLQSYFNLQAIWDEAHLGPFPNLETLCAMYHAGPEFMRRLEWYAEGAQLSGNRWNVFDPDYDLEDDTEVSEAGQGDMLTPEVAIIEKDFLTGPTEPILPTAAFDPESGLYYNPSTGEVLDPPEGQGGDWAQQALDTQEGLEPDGSAEDSFDAEVEVGQNPVLDPPSWLAKGEALHESPFSPINTGAKPLQQDSPEDVTGHITQTFVMGFRESFRDPLKKPNVPCSKKEWDTYVNELRARYDFLCEQKQEFLRISQININLCLERFKRARDSKEWKG